MPVCVPRLGPTDRDPVTAVAWLLRDRRTGRMTIAQLPNLSLGVFLAATVVRRLADPVGAVRAALVVVATTALVWWATDELVRGVNPFRRILGGIVLAATLVGLLVR